jgi:hypothetical protein
MSQITVVQNLPDDRSIKLSIEGQEEVYSLKNPPAVTSHLVLASQKEILQNLSLSSVVSNLANAADLMFVAYNALAGTQVQSKMSGLQKSLPKRSSIIQSRATSGCLMVKKSWL